jgi:polyisoprenoid-binding protein YceI
MKNITLLLAFLIVVYTAKSQSIWNIDATKSKVKFVIDGPFGGDVDGTLNSPSGNIEFDPSILENASFQVNIESNSINTENKKRDEHLKKPEFFDVLKYKTITFISSKVEKSASGYLLIGNLKIKDKTKLIKIEFSFVKNGDVGSWKGKFTMNRLDFGVGESSFMVGDIVKIYIELVAVIK